MLNFVDIGCHSQVASTETKWLECISNLSSFYWMPLSSGINWNRRIDRLINGDTINWMPLSSGINWNRLSCVPKQLLYSIGCHSQVASTETHFHFSQQWLLYSLDATLKWHQLKQIFVFPVGLRSRYWMPLSSGINWNTETRYIVPGTSLDATLKWHQLKQND